MALLNRPMRHTIRRTALCVVLATGMVSAQDAPPLLTRPVNDYANVIDEGSEASMEELIRSLQRASGDVVVVATVETFAPYGDIREYAVEMFENGGKGIGERGKDNGLLVLLAVNDRRVWVEVGYGLEEFITDGFAGETSRQHMLPYFRQGEYGAGLRAGVARLIARIAERRNVQLEGVPRYADDDAGRDELGPGVLVALFVLFLILKGISGSTRRRRRGPWGFGGGWSGWHSGVGSFGGGYRGGFGGGGFGGGFGGFGGFGGGRSGGGGGGAGW